MRSAFYTRKKKKKECYDGYSSCEGFRGWLKEKSLADLFELLVFSTFGGWNALLSKATEIFNKK